jgi:glucose-1-phosphate adenylyltransferase
MNVLSLVLAGGRGTGLGLLTGQRAKPAVPFAGKYRVIDFALSNLVRSGLTQVALLVQFQAESLQDYLGKGEPWGFQDLQTWLPGSEAYTGTADAVYQNRLRIAAMGCDTTLILAGDHIYQQDFRDLLNFHKQAGADLTILSKQVPVEESAGKFGILHAGEDGRISRFVEKPEQPDSTLASTGIYVFNTASLLERLETDARDPESHHDFGRDVLPKIVDQGRAFAYPFEGEWADINSVESYWGANLALLRRSPKAEWAVRTWSVDGPPAWIGQGASVVDSIVSDGCVIEGTVMHSVLSPGVRVEADAVVHNSVLLPGTMVRASALVDRCVVDGAEVGPGASLGVDIHSGPDESQPEVLHGGITVIGSGVRIPAGMIVGRGKDIAEIS